MIRVLLVEDDSEVARIIKYYLGEKERYDVVWAKNAEEAVVASHDWFDVILMDVMLPDQSGIELCARLAQLPCDFYQLPGRQPHDHRRAGARRG